mmetsp:Transcript_2379/g.7604  ORF Transcript_2379/g.7604 Transcript_2379/m.7604 type:complete len:240 (-) Transcript_2379:995-1714(-)
MDPSVPSTTCVGRTASAPAPFRPAPAVTASRTATAPPLSVPARPASATLATASTCPWRRESCVARLRGPATWPTTATARRCTAQPTRSRRPAPSAEHRRATATLPRCATACRPSVPRSTQRCPTARCAGHLPACVTCRNGATVRRTTAPSTPFDCRRTPVDLRRLRAIYPSTVRATVPSAPTMRWHRRRWSVARRLACATSPSGAPARQNFVRATPSRTRVLSVGRRTGRATRQKRARG